MSDPARVCAFHGCHNAPAEHCDCCDTPFCTEHGSVGRDHDTENGPVAWPAMCWKCGGFNADEGLS